MATYTKIIGSAGQPGLAQAMRNAFGLGSAARQSEVRMTHPAGGRIVRAVDKSNIDIEEVRSFLTV